MTTAPTMATSSKTLAISNGSRYASNKPCASVSVFGGNFPAGTALGSKNPWPGTLRDDHSITPTSRASASVTKSATHFCRENCISCTATSRLTSMITKMNSTMIPATYTMTCAMKMNSARSCRKIPAVASSVVIRNTALCMALRRVTIIAALRIATPAKKKKMILSSIRVLSRRLLRRRRRRRSRRGAFIIQIHQVERRGQSDHRSRKHRQPAVPTILHFKNHGHAHSQHVHDCQRNQNVPAQVHQLVEAIARQREAQPHKQVNVRADLQQKPESAVEPRHHKFQGRRQQRHAQDQRYRETRQRHSPHEPHLHAHRLFPRAVHAIRTHRRGEYRGHSVQPVHPPHIRERSQPSAEKQRRRHGADDDHVGVLTQEITGPPKAAVFRHVTGHEFRFRFRQIERCAIRFRN